MAEWQDPAIAGALGIAVGATTAWIQSALAARSKSSEELRATRLEVYPPLWKATSRLSEYPTATVSWDELKKLHMECRQWYFKTGGLYLSDRSRARYGDFQALLSAYLNARHNEQVDDDTYARLMKVGSAMRTALTEDLQTRRQRAFWWSVTRRVWHIRKAWTARLWIRQAGKSRLRCPFDELEAASVPERIGHQHVDRARAPGAASTDV